ncbi:hypothetical protein TOK_2340 [Pseudonocardia sp. N23]|nr:hypothetical protein TOK_2340 [Pseudonocardia sp. N23]
MAGVLRRPARVDRPEVSRTGRGEREMNLADSIPVRPRGGW